MKTSITIAILSSLLFVNNWFTLQNSQIRPLEAKTLSKNNLTKALKLSDYYYIQKSNLDSSLYFGYQAFDIATKIHNDSALGKAQLKLARVYLKKNSLDSSIHYIQNAYGISKSIHNIDIEVISLTKLCYYYIKKNNLVKAMQHALNAMDIAEKSNKISLKAAAYYAISYVYSMHDNNEKYKEYLDKAYKIIRDKNNIEISLKSGVYTSIVDYYEQKRYATKKSIYQDSILLYANEGIEYSKSVQRISSLTYLLGMKGKIYFLKDNTEEAQKYYLEALNYKNDISPSSLSSIFTKLAYVQIKEKDTLGALSYKDSILSHTSSLPSLYRQSEGYKLAYHITKSLKKYELSLKYHELMHKIMDQAKEKEQIELINELEIKYENQKKDTQIIAQKLNMETYKNKAKFYYFTIGLIGLAGILILAYFYFKKKNEALTSDLKLANTKATLHRLQLNPHFISNSINTIYPFLYDKSNPNKAAAYLSDLSQMIRSLLDSSFTKNWSIQEEIKFIKQYCKVQEQKMDIVFKLNISCEKEMYHLSIPSLITQTFIENCFVHGFANKNEQAIISVFVKKEKDQIHIQIIDNGNPSLIQTNSTKSIHSNDIVRERIKSSYQGKKLPNDFLTYGVSNTEYIVKMNLPIL